MFGSSAESEKPFEQLSPADAYELIRWVQPQVTQLLAESERILESINAET